jgi:hypothetical protein
VKHSSEISVYIPTTRLYIAEDGEIHIYRCENLKFYESIFSYSLYERQKEKFGDGTRFLVSEWLLMGSLTPLLHLPFTHSLHAGFYHHILIELSLFFTLGYSLNILKMEVASQCETSVNRLHNTPHYGVNNSPHSQQYGTSTLKILTDFVRRRTFSRVL